MKIIYLIFHAKFKDLTKKKTQFYEMMVAQKVTVLGDPKRRRLESIYSFLFWWSPVAICLFPTMSKVTVDVFKKILHKICTIKNNMHDCLEN